MMVASGIKERPILFTPAMAQAIAEGRKTQTRRVIKAWTSHPAVADWVLDSEGRAAARAHNEEVARQYVTSFPHARVLCPYGVPGDRLWVRESVYIEPGTTAANWKQDSDDVLYRGAFSGGHVSWAGEGGVRWKPNIHMPRWACRSVLEVVSVRVERVESITEDDARAEGLELRESGYWHSYYGHEFGKARDAFLDLFYRINKRAPEGSNPWVWVVEFKKLQA